MEKPPTVVLSMLVHDVISHQDALLYDKDLFILMLMILFSLVILMLFLFKLMRIEITRLYIVPWLVFVFLFLKLRTLYVC